MAMGTTLWSETYSQTHQTLLHQAAQTSYSAGYVFLLLPYNPQFQRLSVFFPPFFFNVCKFAHTTSSCAYKYIKCPSPLWIPCLKTTCSILIVIIIHNIWPLYSYKSGSLFSSAEDPDPISFNCPSFFFHLLSFVHIHTYNTYNYNTTVKSNLIFISLPFYIYTIFSLNVFVPLA